MLEKHPQYSTDTDRTLSETRGNRTTEKPVQNQTKEKVQNSKLKSKLVVNVNEEVFKSVNVMTCALYRLKRRLNKLQSMQSSHLPPFFKGMMQLKGGKKKKEVIVTDKINITQSFMPQPCSGTVSNTYGTGTSSQRSPHTAGSGH